MPDRFAQQLYEASDKLDDLSRSDIQILLRRAALRVTNKTQAAGTTVLIPEVAAMIDEFAAARGVSRDEAVNLALTDWAIGMGFMSKDDLEEDSETDGEA